MAHQNFEGANLKEYFERYASALNNALKKIDVKSLDKALEKIKEMQIEVDWQELYRSTLGRQFKKWSRILPSRLKDS